MKISMRVRDSGPLRDAWPLRDGLRRAMPKAAADLARDVRERTAAGHDVNGRPFAALTSGEWSTLQRSGAMVEGFAPVAVTDRGFILGLRDRRLRARAKMHQDGIGRLPQREWIGLDSAQSAEYVDRLVAAEIPPDRDRS